MQFVRILYWRFVFITSFSNDIYLVLVLNKNDNNSLVTSRTNRLKLLSNTIRIGRHVIEAAYNYNKRKLHRAGIGSSITPYLSSTVDCTLAVVFKSV